jgi:hypothetical protein
MVGRRGIGPQDGGDVGSAQPVAEAIARTPYGHGRALDDQCDRLQLLCVALPRQTCALQFESSPQRRQGVIDEPIEGVRRDVKRLVQDIGIAGAGEGESHPLAPQRLLASTVGR